VSDNPIQEVLNDLFRHLEVLETQNAAILQVLKDKKLITEKKFSSYLDQAAVASDIKWRAARVRMEHVFANAPEPRTTSSASRTREAPETGEGKQEPPKAVSSDADALKAKESVDRDQSGEKQSVSANGQGQDQHTAGTLQGEAKSHALSPAAESATSEPSKKHTSEKSSPAPEKKTVAEKSEAATHDRSEPAKRGEQNPTEGDSENSNSAIGLANPSEKEAA
jgi:hypothetical protein